MKHDEAQLSMAIRNESESNGGERFGSFVVWFVAWSVVVDVAYALMD